MNKTFLRNLSVAILAVMTLMLVTAQPAAAQEAGTEVEITGTVLSIDEASRSFTVKTENGETYTVFPGEGFDFKTLVVGDTVEVKGTLKEDGTGSGVIFRAEEPDDDPDDVSSGYYCRQSEDPHPFGEWLAVRYELDYTTLQAWFCDGFGWGQVMLALRTGQITGETPDTYLEARRGGQGWGQIWQELRLIGRSEEAGSPDHENREDRPDFAGPPQDKERGGPPDFTGPQNDGEGHGRPDFAGPHNEEENGSRPDFAGPPDGKGPNTVRHK